MNPTETTGTLSRSAKEGHLLDLLRRIRPLWPPPLAGPGDVDMTVGSALDLFGGKGLCYRNLVAWSRRDT